jgi:hypothetical protein
MHLLIVSPLMLSLISPAEAQTKSGPPTQAGPQQQRPVNAKPEPTQQEGIDAEAAKHRAVAEAREKARDARLRRDTQGICTGC